MFSVFQPLVFSNLPEREYFRNSSSGDPLKTHVSGGIYYCSVEEFRQAHNRVA